MLDFIIPQESTMSIEKMQKLHSQGKTYRQIADELGCANSTVCYHLAPDQKQKHRDRASRYRLNNPIVKKLERFFYSKQYKQKPKTNRSTRRLIQDKIKTFHKVKNMKYNKPTFTAEDVYQKFGTNPICYLTGEDIDLNRPRTYHFDHIIPKSRGGSNNIDNLGIATKQANQSKFDMTHDEYLELCKRVLRHHGFSVDKSDL